MGPCYDHGVSLALRIQQDPADCQDGDRRCVRSQRPAWLRQGQSTQPPRPAIAPRRDRWPLPTLSAPTSRTA